jgi:uncharacterized protein (DUF58 family)
MKAGRILLAMLFCAGLAGTVLSGAALYTRFLLFSLFLAVLSWFWTRWSARGIRLERRARELRANVGDVFEEQFGLTNDSRLTLPWVEVVNQSTIPMAAGSRLFTLVGRRQKRNYTARTWLTRRGGFPLGPTRVTTGDPFGLFSAGKTLPAEETLVVFPVIHEIQSFPFPPGLLPGGRVIQRKSHDITPHASGLREYVHGDAMKRIHWRSSARREKLMVKEFEQDPQAEIWLCLDSQGLVHFEKPHRQEEISSDAALFVKRPKYALPPSTLEYAVSAAASLAHYFIRRRFSVGYASAGQAYTVLPAERGERQEAKILETLAFVQANGKLSIAALVSVQSAQMPHGSSVMLITPTVRHDLLNAVDDLLLRHLRPVVILFDALTFGGPAGTDKLAAALHERRVPVYVIPCGADLSHALSETKIAYPTQDIPLWQGQISSPSI